MILLLILALLLPQPTQADLDELGAILCGETGGMPLQAQEFVARQLRHDWYRLGTDGMSRRWYGYKLNADATELMRRIFEEPVPTEWCEFVGSGQDVVHWKENGYLAPDAVPDYWQEYKSMTVAAFGCRWQEVRVTWWQECVGDRCPR